MANSIIIDYDRLNTLTLKRQLDPLNCGDTILMVLEDYLSDVDAPMDYRVEFNGGSGVVALISDERTNTNYRWCKVKKIDLSFGALEFDNGKIVYFQR